MNINILKKIILALDVPDLKKAEFILNELDGVLHTVKIGSATFYRLGEDILKLLKERKLGIFIDFKFHDIPNTVKGAAEGIVPWGVSMFTVHTLGGKAMLEAVVRRTRECAEKYSVERPWVLGISVLTSQDETTFSTDFKISVRFKDLISNMALLALGAGLDGLVASGNEIALIRAAVGHRLKIVCPGIRMEKDTKGDQKRTISGSEAIKAGADFIVVGRPIYEAIEPRKIIEEMSEEISRAIK